MVKTVKEKVLTTEDFDNDKYFPRVDVTKMKVYNFEGKKFAYNNGILQCLFQDEDELEQLGKDAPWRVLDSISLSREDWEENKKYWMGKYADEIDEESSALSTDFIKYELPYYQSESKAVKETRSKISVEAQDDYKSVKMNSYGWFVYYGWITDGDDMYYHSVKSDHKLSKDEIEKLLLDYATDSRTESKKVVKKESQNYLDEYMKEIDGADTVDKIDEIMEKAAKEPDDILSNMEYEKLYDKGLAKAQRYQFRNRGKKESFDNYEFDDIEDDRSNLYLQYFDAIDEAETQNELEAIRAEVDESYDYDYISDGDYSLLNRKIKHKLARKFGVGSYKTREIPRYSYEAKTK